MMPQAEAFVRIAERSLDAANAILPAAIQEAAGFYAYHAFESLGGALCVHHGHQPPRTPHSSKIIAFQGFANEHPFAGDVATLAIIVESLRNDLLYPSRPTPEGLTHVPDERYTLDNARDLIKDVTNLLGQIAPVI